MNFFYPFKPKYPEWYDLSLDLEYTIQVCRGERVNVFGTGNVETLSERRKIDLILILTLLASSLHIKASRCMKNVKLKKKVFPLKKKP